MELQAMHKITQSDYYNFLELNKEIIIEDQHITIGGKYIITQLQPDNFELEIENIWSFPERGKWATHYLNAKYRGNYAPQVPRNIILRYSMENDTILDPFIGSGTTLIESKLLKRHGIGIDINKGSTMITMDRLNFNSGEDSFPEQEVYTGDARNLNKIPDDSIDLVVTHPPYANIIAYSKNDKIEGDLSRITDINEYYKQMRTVAAEIFRVVKGGKYCAILFGDSRKYKHQIPLSFRLMDIFLEQGFILKEDVIKFQHNTKTRQYWKKASVEKNFLLLAYEHLFIFRKPEGKATGIYKYSMKA
ncbi:MAG: DNA methyltransferase [Ferroplasma sp.]|uniref:TRM11 family SAM-dependent methyltransferase n=1 Tax=Ferroplasma sp. TaxID=2591003 RepID=UPI0028156F4A|nr:DNA methyltransferase [Ferroplasma sp.]WMT50566.1 MAG: DNA methyltransferase [Ferroplasma sp.]